MLKLLAIIACLVAVSCAFPVFPGFPYHPLNNYYYWGNPAYFGGYYYGGYPYGHYTHYGATPGSRLIYYGQFKGSCDGEPDGLYYVDQYSFAYCSNGQKTIQPCAEGSANPPVAHFKHGGYYGLYDFCAVNLVAHSAPKHHAPVHPAPAAVHPPVHHVDQAPPHGKVPVVKEEHYSEEGSYVVEEKGHSRGKGYPFGNEV